MRVEAGVNIAVPEVGGGSEVGFTETGFVEEGRVSLTEQIPVQHESVTVFDAVNLIAEAPVVTDVSAVEPIKIVGLVEKLRVPLAIGATSLAAISCATAGPTNWTFGGSVITGIGMGIGGFALGAGIFKDNNKAATVFAALGGGAGFCSGGFIIPEGLILSLETGVPLAGTAAIVFGLLIGVREVLGRLSGRRE